VPLTFAVRRSGFFDSVALMRVADEARRLAGVREVAAVMGTPANRAMLAEAGMLPAEAPATEAADLLIVVDASTGEAASAALARVTDLLNARREAGPGDDVVRPRTLTSAARGGANVAVVAVPGSHAALEAHQALSAGLHVFLFSDGVSLDEEIALKRRASALGLFVMGPECGTAIIQGVGFGFANRVRRGTIGVVGASGTGIQEVTTLIHRLGAGVSHAIGTGGRDLHAAVGGITTRQALERLGADADTRVIVIVSKPSAREVADGLLAAAATSGKPVVACLLGYDGAVAAGIHDAATLEDAARIAVMLAPDGRTAALVDPPVPAPRHGGAIRGLYTGGTLCDEARRLSGGPAHRFVDFGDEAYTRGRPHPIIDPSRRHAAILEAAGEPGVGVLLLDLVLGDCAHPDPAGALDLVLAEACGRAGREGRELSVVAHVVGTDGDVQDLPRQEATLRRRGVIVCASNRLAALTARALASPDGRHAT
jgi:succinyl-CoA synthetase alpha subunit